MSAAATSGCAVRISLARSSVPEACQEPSSGTDAAAMNAETCSAFAIRRTTIAGEPRACAMTDALLVHRLQFAFTATFHYLFPQLTIGLAPLIVILKSLAIARSDERYNEAARFWARIFGINFTLGVVTGIPMEFQFGTNWASFSRSTGG